MHIVLMGSAVSNFVTLWTVACQAPLSMEFSRQEYWRGLPFPPPGDRPDPGIVLVSPASPAPAGKFLYHCTTWEAPRNKSDTDLIKFTNKFTQKICFSLNDFSNLLSKN